MREQRSIRRSGLFMEKSVPTIGIVERGKNVERNGERDREASFAYITILLLFCPPPGLHKCKTATAKSPDSRISNKTLCSPQLWAPLHFCHGRLTTVASACSVRGRGCMYGSILSDFVSL